MENYSSSEDCSCSTNSNVSDSSYESDSELIFDERALESTQLNTQKIDSDVFVDIVRTNSSQKKCVVCNRKRLKNCGKKFERVSDQAIVDAYLKTSLLIPFDCRACKHHLDSFGFLKQNSLGKTNN